MKSLIHIVFIVFFSSGISFAQEREVLKPKGAKTAVKLLSGHNKTYFQLSKTTTIDFPVENFERVILYSRKRISDKTKTYRIAYRFDSKEEKEYKVEKIKRDFNCVYSDKTIQNRVSKAFKKEIEVPNGAKVLQLHLIKSKEVAIKLIGYKDKSKLQLTSLNKEDKTHRITSGKTLSYYKLKPKQPTTIKTNSAGKLLVYTRVRLDQNPIKSYRYSYKMGKNKSQEVRVEKVRPSKKTVYKSLSINAVPSEYQRTTISVTSGDEQIVFYSDFPVDARFVFIPKHIKGSWERVRANKTDIVSLLVKKDKKERKYSRISTEKAFRFNINTDKLTKIKLYIRGEFTYDMHANNDYEIVLRDYNKIINTYKLSCSRSEVMNYKSDDERIPGTLDKILIDVPQGKHKYSLMVNNKGKTALLRVLRKR